MHWHWFPLTLLCALSLATADALGKKLLTGYSAMELVLVRFVGATALLAPLLWNQPFPPLPAPFWGWVALSIPLEILAMLLYMRAVRDGELSLSLPHLSFTPVITVLLGELVLGEQVSAAGLAGILLVVLGTFQLHVQRSGGLRARLSAPFRAVGKNPAVRAMMIVALIYSVTVVTTKAALQYLPGSRFGPLYFGLLGCVTLVMAGAFQPSSLKVLARNPLRHMLVAGLFAVMVYTHFLAIEQVQAAYMVAVKRSSIVFSVIYGSVLFDERALRKRLAAAALMVAGVALIGLRRAAE